MVGMETARATRRGARRVSLLGRPALLVAALATSLAASGTAYQAIAAALDRRRYPPPGRLVDVGGHRLHVHTTGPVGAGARGPTVILESGVGATSAGWAWVQQEVARFAGVVSCDRAGIGWSEEGAEAADARGAAERLRAALAGAGVAGPYVLVGHSLGGEYARVFAGLYPGEVSGMVLVDAGAPDTDGVMRVGAAAPSSPGVPVPEGTMGQVERAFRLFHYAPLAARLGVLRIALALGGATDPLPPKRRAAARASMSSPRHWRAVRAEVAGSWEAAAQARASGGLGEKPLVVLNRAVPEGGVTRAIQAFGVELAASLSSDGKHRVVEGADHFSLLANREHARSVAEAIREVVEAARGRSRP